MSEDSPLNITLFGAPQVLQGGKPVTGFLTHKVRALFFYLAMSGEPHTRDALAGLLWAEMPNQDARVNLRKALSNLRQLFPEALRINRHTAAFNPLCPHTLDVADFQALTARLQDDLPPDEHLAILEQAVAIYRGEFLAGFYLADAPAFDEWAFGWRERLSEQALQARHALAQACLKNRLYPQAITHLQHILAIDPWREEAHRKLMMAFAQQGQYDAALAQYQACKDTLAAELDILPSPETHLLYERIKARKTAPAISLPQQPTAFLGRTQELEALSATLTNTTCRLLIITGIGGVGKTRLALELASRMSTHFFDGVFFIAAVSLYSPEALLGAIGDSIGMPFSEQGSLLAQLTRYLQQREILLVLDNFEHLVDATHLLEHLLENTPHLRLLVTSRKRLHTPWEHVFTLQGFPTQSDTTPEGSLPLPVQVFLQSARRVRHDFALTPEKAQTVLQICRHLGGVPLGIELAARWVASLTCRQILEKIRRGSGILDVERSEQRARDHGLQAVLEYAWQQLTPQDQRRFARMATFHDAFTASAAAEVAQADAQTLEHLLEYGVIVRAPGEDASARYTMHPLWRQFAQRALAAQPAEEAQARSAHQRHYARRLAEYAQALSAGGLETPPSRHDFNNILGAWPHILADGAYADFEQYTRHLTLLLETQKRYEELRPILLQAIERAQGEAHTPPHVLARWLRLVGEALFRTGQLPESLQYHRQALALVDTPLPKSALAQGIALGRVLLHQARNRIWMGRPIDRQTLQARRRLEAARIYERLGQILFFQSAPTPILLYLSIRGMNLAEEVTPSGTLARLYGNMILGAGLVSLHKLARFYRRAALATARHIQSADALSWVLELSSIYHCGIGAWEESMQEAEQALHIAEQVNDTRRRNECLVMPAHIAYAHGDFRRSAELWLEIYLAAHQMGDVQAERWGLSGQAENFIPLGRLEEAISYLQATLDLPLKVADIGTDISCYGLLAYALLLQGRQAEALQAAESGLRLVESTSPTAFSSLNGYISLARVFLRLWEAAPQDAALTKNAALAENELWAFSKIFTLSRPSAFLQRGMLNWLRGQKRKALLFWQRGIAAAQSQETPYIEAKIYTEMGRRLPEGDSRKREALQQARDICARLHVPLP